GPHGSLGVGVDDEYAPAPVGHKAGEGMYGGGFCDAAPLIEDHQAGHRSRFLSFTIRRILSISCRVQRRYRFIGLRWGSGIRLDFSQFFSVFLVIPRISATWPVLR